LKLVEAQYVGGRLGERLAELVVLLYGARNCFRAEFEKICELEVSTDLDLGRSPIGGDESVRGEVEELVCNRPAEGQRDDDGEELVGGASRLNSLSGNRCILSTHPVRPTLMAISYYRRLLNRSSLSLHFSSRGMGVEGYPPIVFRVHLYVIQCD